MLGGDGGFATARWREPASSDRLPSHRSEPPTGYSSAGCSPAVWRLRFFGQWDKLKADRSKEA
jgi:hypothetical protein